MRTEPTLVWWAPGFSDRKDVDGAAGDTFCLSGTQPATCQRLLADRWVLPNPEEDVMMFSAGLPVSLTVAFTDPAHPVARMVYSVRLRLEEDLEESRSQSFVMT